MLKFKSELVQSFVDLFFLTSLYFLLVILRYRNFDKLHQHLKDIPNYSLHLPPKRIFSSSTEDAFVHKRCILLDKYLQVFLVCIYNLKALFPSILF